MFRLWPSTITADCKVVCGIGTEQTLDSLNTTAGYALAALHIGATSGLQKNSFWVQKLPQTSSPCIPMYKPAKSSIECKLKKTKTKGKENLQIPQFCMQETRTRKQQKVRLLDLLKRRQNPKDQVQLILTRPSTSRFQASGARVSSWASLCNRTSFQGSFWMGGKNPPATAKNS